MDVVRDTVDAWAEPEVRGPGPWARKALTNPLPSIVALTLVGLSFTLRKVDPGLDPSWGLGLGLASRDGLAHGGELIFTYGPLGFLAQPSELTRLQPVLSLLYALAVCGAFFSALTLLARRWMGPGEALGLGLLVAVTWGLYFGLSERATVTAILLTVLLLPPVRTGRPHGWVFVAAGGVAAFHLMVKFSAGATMLPLPLLLAVTWRSRLRNVSLVALGSVGGLLLLWVAAGQAVGDLGTWMVNSVEIAAAYNADMATDPVGRPASYFLAPLVPLLGGVLLAAGLWLRREGRRGLPFVVALAFGSWSFLKQGLVRFDEGHLIVAYLGVGTLAFAAPWRRRERFVPVAAVALSLIAVLLIQTWPPTKLPTASPQLVRARRAVVVSAGGALRSAADPSYHRARLAASRARVLRAYAVPSNVTGALAGRRVHAEPVDIAALWALDLEWAPLPSMQSYAAITEEMDDRNAAALLAPSGPTGILYREMAIDRRYWLWQSPAAQLALTCGFATVATGTGMADEGQPARWSALVRRGNVCGAPRPRGRVVAHSGEVVSIPSVDEGNLMVASFELSPPLVDRIATSVAKPLAYPMVEIDGVRHRFVTGTAGQPHLLVVPDRVAGRIPPPGQIAHRRLRFVDVHGQITIRFAEIRVDEPPSP